MDRTHVILANTRTENSNMNRTPLTSFSNTVEKSIDLDALVEGYTAQHIGLALQAEVDTIKEENKVEGDVRFYMGPNGLTAYWTPVNKPCVTAQAIEESRQETMERRQKAIRDRAQEKLRSACKTLGINPETIS